MSPTFALVTDRPSLPGTERSAVVGDDDDQRPVVDPRGVEAAEKPAEEDVRIAHLEEMALVRLPHQPRVVVWRLRLRQPAIYALEPVLQT